MTVLRSDYHTLLALLRQNVRPQAGQVVVMDGGRVVGSGTHESLLVGCPQHVELVDSQLLGAGVGDRP